MRDYFEFRIVKFTLIGSIAIAVQLMAILFAAMNYCRLKTLEDELSYQEKSAEVDASFDSNLNKVAVKYPARSPSPYRDQRSNMKGSRDSIKFIDDVKDDPNYQYRESAH